MYPLKSSRDINLVQLGAAVMVPVLIARLIWIPVFLLQFKSGTRCLPL
jgi:hypothetical protein